MAELTVNLQPGLLGVLFHLFSNGRINKDTLIKNQALLLELEGKQDLHVLLADDDEDDRQFFTDAINVVAPKLKLTTVQNGEELIYKLKNKITDLPDVIFLDLNMPYKNGMECLKEIKSVEALKNIPVLIYSTSAHRDQVEITYRNGANLYIQKPSSYEGIIRVLKTIFTLPVSEWFEQPSREKFVLK